MTMTASPAIGIRTVSYTHLDVYKRQDCNRDFRHQKGSGVSKTAFWRQQLSADKRQAERTAALDPVSYTHLDVYKRQLRQFPNLKHITLMSSKPEQVLPILERCGIEVDLL